MSKSTRASARPSVSICLDEAQVSRIDALAESSSTPWHKTSRAEVVRTFVNQGLASLAAVTPPGAKRKPTRASLRRPARRRAATP